MMFELGCHLIDLVVKILGEPTDVHGYLNHAGAQKDALMDNTLAVLEYPRAIATVRSTGLEVDGGSRRHLLVCGTEGTFQIQPLDNPLVKLNLNKAVGKYPRGSSEVTLPKYTRYTADAADMAKVIRGEKTSDYSYAHDLAVQRTLLKACGM